MDWGRTRSIFLLTAIIAFGILYYAVNPDSVYGSNPNRRIPRDVGGTAYSMTPVFDSMFVDTVDDIPADWLEVSTTYGNPNSNCGVLIVNHNTSVTLEVRLSAMDESSDYIYIGPSSSFWCPVRSPSIYVREAPSVPDIEFQFGYVK